MDFFEVIKSRRSVRKFTPQSVDNKLIEKALQAAILAPNSSNLQPWEFYWIQTDSLKVELTKACFNQNAARTSQQLIFVVSRIDTWNRNRQLILNSVKNPPKFFLDYYKKLIPYAYLRDPFYIKDLMALIITTIIGFFRPVPRTSLGRSRNFESVTKSTALACENLMLALVAQGLSCCPMEGFDEWRVKKILKLNRHCHVVMGIGIGYAAENGIYGEQFRIPSELVIKIV